jgi:hypothetical protein
MTREGERERERERERESLLSRPSQFTHTRRQNVRARGSEAALTNLDEELINVGCSLGRSLHEHDVILLGVLLRLIGINLALLQPAKETRETVQIQSVFSIIFPPGEVPTPIASVIYPRVCARAHDMLVLAGTA